MILYHGTNTDFQEIDLLKSRRHKDFGQGFYLTDIKEQAEDLARKRVLISGGNAIVQRYEFDEKSLTNKTLNILHFETASVEWAQFIYKNRSRILNFHHNYDIIIGPIADDGVAYLLDRYEENTITLEQLAQKLKFKKLNNQYYFGTERSIKLLKRIYQ